MKWQKQCRRRGGCSKSERIQNVKKIEIIQSVQKSRTIRDSLSIKKLPERTQGISWMRQKAAEHRVKSSK
jgi:hypothetical protein